MRFSAVLVVLMEHVVEVLILWINVLLIGETGVSVVVATSVSKG